MADSGKDELARALADVARNDADAKDIIDAWLRQRTSVPKPANFYGLKEARTIVQLATCPKCHGYGRVDRPGAVGPIVGLAGLIAASMPCSCPAGARWRAVVAAEAQRDGIERRMTA